MKEKPDTTEGGSQRGYAGLVSLTASLRLGDRWFARLTWNRVASFYNHDSDVVVLGVGASTSCGWP